MQYTPGTTLFALLLEPQIVPQVLLGSFFDALAPLVIRPRFVLPVVVLIPRGCRFPPIVF